MTTDEENALSALEQLVLQSTSWNEIETFLKAGKVSLSSDELIILQQIAELGAASSDELIDSFPHVIKIVGNLVEVKTGFGKWTQLTVPILNHIKTIFEERKL